MSVLFSIIIPSYNRANLISHTLQSVIDQTYSNWECIVVDDGSTDNSLQVCADFSRKNSKLSVLSRPSEIPKGANGCRNFGFEHSKGELVLWFDSDDIMESNYLEEIVNVYETHSKASLYFCQHQIFKEQPKPIIQQHQSVRPLEVKALILRKQFLQTGAAIWDRSFLLQMQNDTELFDSSLSQSQDYDFFCRALMRQPEVVQIPKVLYHFRRGNDSISEQFVLGNTDHLQSYLTVKKKLSKLNKGNNNIVIGLLNHVLAAYRFSLKGDPKSNEILKHYLRDWTKEFDEVSAFRIKKILVLGDILKVLGRGNTYLKKCFYIKPD